jgi:hypothetical protein
MIFVSDASVERQDTLLMKKEHQLQVRVDLLVVSMAESWAAPIVRSTSMARSGRFPAADARRCSHLHPRVHCIGLRLIPYTYCNI